MERPDLIHLSAAQGWLGLGNHIEANEELEKIAPQNRTHPDVLEVRWEVYAQASRWNECLDIAQSIIKLAPRRSIGWIHRSFALHELKRTGEAFDELVAVAGKFAKVWTIPYNLACYSAQLARLDESATWFKQGMAIDEQNVKAAGIDDPDLEPLWKSMSGTSWKRVE